MRSELGWSNVMWAIILSYIRPEGRLHDAEHDLLAIAKFLAFVIIIILFATTGEYMFCQSTSVTVFVQCRSEKEVQRRARS